MSADFVAGSIERVRGYGVKEAMARVRIALRSVLPVLWLATAWCCLANPANGRTDGSDRTRVCAGAEGGHAPLTAGLAFDQCARLMSRRGGMPAGWVEDLMPAAAWRGEVHKLGNRSDLPTVSSEALGLARCWQFYWRTALEPRAPSSVS
jgi:hypothetical protein